MFTGLITGAGPRYCPSIEDKIFRFADKDSHTIVLEPEGFSSNTLYVNGFSTSLPKDVQDAGIRTIPGLEESTILRYGYAVEYDFFYPFQLTFGLQSKALDGLFFAGQVNGTSGYEEAGAQGLIAGINAALYVRNEGTFTLQRSEAYIGVMIDDLVNKNTEEPYRIFTSLAEYRLLLRIDTVYDRLLPYGSQLGLVPNHIRERYELMSERTRTLLSATRTSKVAPGDVNPVLSSKGESPISEPTTAINVLRRPTMSVVDVLEFVEGVPVDAYREHIDVLHRVDTTIKYEGYIEKQQRDVQRFAEQEQLLIPPTFTYDNVRSLSTEGREKLKRIRPGSLGQASRIPGVSASDVSILSLYLR
jgi:tRNA uridine 5-carboxymethylaminomethyl modification enzyme